MRKLNATTGTRTRTSLQRRDFKSFGGSSAKTPPPCPASRVVSSRLAEPHRLVTNPVTSEVWRSIPGYDEYEASSEGRVRNVTTGRVLRPGDNGHGYRIVGVGRGAARRMRYVHRLVAAAFIGLCPDGCEVDHLNSCRAANQPTNLEYVTHHENNRRAAERRRPAESPRCSRCARVVRALRRDLCGRCYEYRRRAGVDRPLDMMANTYGHLSKDHRQRAVELLSADWATVSIGGDQ